ncbi:hypothetical protein TrispH2_000461 [Trichoplax sp. H2]|uniref:Uncharacterized protein n=1 Tax=Trichoplax adhaerens TaxID=10228 RepID=B3S6N9_TRIAD|nr:predicted protein [Trichoplax adhaerens]EDV21789.1 predicted protein [Trichoplax adhaerens]RDD47334.1 hypothetical protein TrispH2_000461 [Trichoplax sp. H2]|eukprot:XP_002115937.1 predicted protein [Trichoplax adhaerens]
MKCNVMNGALLLATLCITVGILTHEVHGGVLTSIKPKSCLEIRYSTENKTAINGFYAIHTDATKVQPVYCDFQSDPPFVWTLVESFTRTRGVYTSKIPGSISFHKPYYYNYPYNDCSPQFKAYRLNRPTMMSIYKAPRTTHWRATCNFDKIKKYPMSHKDYIRNSICRYDILNIYSAQPGCYFVDYLNVRGHTCRNCQVPIYVAPSYHVNFMSSRSYYYCQKWKFPSEFTFNPPESNFGYYYRYSVEHECTSSKDATTNYWFGGIYQPSNKLINYSLL